MGWKLLGESVDPVTGDKLSAGERVSWMIQRVIRRWSFIAVIQLITAVCWATRNAAVLTWWNLAASDFAIIMEFLIGIAMLGQTMRDALVSREVRAIARRVEEMARVLVKDVDAIEEQLEEQGPSQPSKASKRSRTLKSAPIQRSGGTRASDARSAARGKPRSGPSGKPGTVGKVA